MKRFDAGLATRVALVGLLLLGGIRPRPGAPSAAVIKRVFHACASGKAGRERRGADGSFGGSAA
jgi:hypothetical protein